MRLSQREWNRGPSGARIRLEQRRTDANRYYYPPSLSFSRLHGRADLLRRVGQIGRRKNLGDFGLGQELAGAVYVCTFQADDDRHFEAYFLGGVDQGLGDHVALGDAAEDVDEYALD